MTDEKDNAVELARIAFIKAAMTIERDVRLHELTHDETNALVCAVLNTRTDNDVSGLVEALEPFARLELPAKPTGNTGFYSIFFKQIEDAQTAIAKHRQSNGGEA